MAKMLGKTPKRPGWTVGRPTKTVGWPHGPGERTPGDEDDVPDRKRGTGMSRRETTRTPAGTASGSVPPPSARWRADRSYMLPPAERAAASPHGEAGPLARSRRTRISGANRTSGVLPRGRRTSRIPGSARLARGVRAGSGSAPRSSLVLTPRQARKPGCPSESTSRSRCYWDRSVG